MKPIFQSSFLEVVAKGRKVHIGFAGNMSNTERDIRKHFELGFGVGSFNRLVKNSEFAHNKYNIYNDPGYMWVRVISKTKWDELFGQPNQAAADLWAQARINSAAAIKG